MALWGLLCCDRQLTVTPKASHRLLSQTGLTNLEGSAQTNEVLASSTSLFSEGEAGNLPPHNTNTPPPSHLFPTSHLRLMSLMVERCDRSSGSRLSPWSLPSRLGAPSSYNTGSFLPCPPLTVKTHQTQTQHTQQWALLKEEESREALWWRRHLKQEEI